MKGKYFECFFICRWSGLKGVFNYINRVFNLNLKYGFFESYGF